MKRRSDARETRFPYVPRRTSLRNPGFAFIVAGGALTSCGSSQVVDGPSPLAELTVLGAVVTEAQPRPGADVTRHRMRVHESPNAPPRLPANEVPMEPDELVVGLVLDGQAVAYPLRFLNLVEVVNDTVAEGPLVVTWCSLAGTAAVFHRERGNRTLTFHFGTSLIHDSLLLVDEQSGSVWAQVSRKAISGLRRGETLDPIHSVQTTWAFWQQRHPDTRVMVFPGEAGLPYHYADFPPDHFPDPQAEAHDPRPVGVGVVVGDEPWFFPFVELNRVYDDGLDFADGSRRVVYEADGMTAWVEDEAGTVIDSQVAYQRAWLAFHPGSRIFRATGVGEHRGEAAATALPVLSSTEIVD